MNLTSDESEAGAEFNQKTLEMLKQPRFKFALVKGFFQREEIKNIGVF